MTRLSENQILFFAKELLMVETLNDYFGLLRVWIPKILPCDHYNIIIGNFKTGVAFRHMSPGFPTALFADYKGQWIKSDLITQKAGQLPPGGMVHLQDLLNQADPPEDWPVLVDFVINKMKLPDAVTLVLNNDFETGWAAGLCVYRSDKSPVFRKSEINYAAKFSELISSAFQKCWENSLARFTIGNMEKIFNVSGTVSFMVTEKGMPVKISGLAENSLREYFDDPFGDGELPELLYETIMNLTDAMKNPEGDKLYSQDIFTRRGIFRLYLSPVEEVRGDARTFFAMLVPDHGIVNLGVLGDTVLTPREVEVLEYLQRGLSTPQMAQALEISENTVKFHLSNIGEKIGAGGRTEVLSRAIALSHEIAIERALGGNQTQH